MVLYGYALVVLYGIRTGGAVWDTHWVRAVWVRTGAAVRVCTGTCTVTRSTGIGASVIGTESTYGDGL